MCDRDLLVWAAQGPSLLFPPFWGFALACSGRHVAARHTSPLLIPGTASGAGRTLLPKAPSPSVSSRGTNCPSTPAGAVSWGPSVRSVSAPSPPGASPSPHHQCMGHPLPTQTGSCALVGGGAGISQICGISAEVPAAPNGSAHPPETAGNQMSQSTPCIPAPFSPHLPAAQPLA